MSRRLSLNFHGMMKKLVDIENDYFILDTAKLLLYY